MKRLRYLLHPARLLMLARLARVSAARELHRQLEDYKKPIESDLYNSPDVPPPARAQELKREGELLYAQRCRAMAVARWQGRLTWDGRIRDV